MQLEVGGSGARQARLVILRVGVLKWKGAAQGRVELV
jgi:hypothetical protein